MAFIKKLAPFAVRHGFANGVLPSLIIAQGILESASGASELARSANNLFGIKAGSGWTGPTYTKKTKEQRLDGTVYYVDAEFRKYPSYEGCVVDLIGKYVNGTGWESFNRYAAVLNQTDFKKATAAVFAAGYATDINYPVKLKKLIVQHNLAQYDRRDNVVKIFIDPGHGGGDPGAVGHGLKEKDLTLKISLKIRDILEKEYNNVDVRLSRTTDVYLTLAQRTNAANGWNADFLLSVHINATPGGYGYEDYVHDGPVSPLSLTSQSDINSEVSKVVPEFRNRGKKRKNLHMLRESRMPAVLTESGFIDNPSDAKLLKSDEFLNRLARGHVNGIAKAFSLSKKTVVTPPKKEETRMFKPSSPTLKKAVVDKIEAATKSKVLSDGKWLAQAKNGTLSLDDALALSVHIDNAKNK